MLALRAELDKIAEDAKPHAKLRAEITHKSGTDQKLYPWDYTAAKEADLALIALGITGAQKAQQLLDMLIERDGLSYDDAPDSDADHWAALPKPTSSSEMLFDPTSSQFDPKLNKVRDSYVVNDKQTVTHNASIRSGNPTPAAKSWRTRMSKMVRTGQLESDGVLYRGAVLTPEMVVQIRPGVVLTDPGIISTDQTHNSAVFYAATRIDAQPGTIPVIFEVRARKGTYAADVGYGEFVLDANSRMRVVSTRRVTETTPKFKTGHIEVVVELLQ